MKPLLGKDEEVVIKALRTNTAYLQREVAHRVKMKYAAKLKFLADESFDEGSHIDSLLRSPKVSQDLEEGKRERGDRFPASRLFHPPFSLSEVEGHAVTVVE